MSRAEGLSPRRRILALLVLLLCADLVLFSRLVYWQAFRHDDLSRLAASYHDDQLVLPAVRGKIVDRNGDLLVANRPVFSIFATPDQIKPSDRPLEADRLAAVLQLDPGAVLTQLQSSRMFVYLKRRVSSAVASRIDHLQLPGIGKIPETERTYVDGALPGTSLASDLLGFVNADGRGNYGVEGYYDHLLRGQDGFETTVRDLTGRPIVLSDRQRRDPVDGATLQLSLDSAIQVIAERALADGVARFQAESGSILIMEPRTGNILAAANNPTYNLTADEIYNPQRQDLYRAKIITDQYEPGSTLKTIAMSAALDSGLVTPGTTMNDTGVAVVAGSVIHNWNGAANGTSSMTDVLIHSSNVGMTWVSGVLGADRLYEYLGRYGFGQPTGLRLPGEVSGTVRTNHDPGWTRVDQATNAYGQGIAVTPVQLLQAVAVFANEGQLVRPRLVRAIRGPDGDQDVPPEVERQVISPKTAHSMLQMLVAVHEQPDLKAYRVPGYHIAAKTGTADTPTNVGYNTALTIGSLVALFPAEAPRFVVLIRLDGPERLYGGLVAAPVLKDLAQELLTYYRVPPST